MIMMIMMINDDDNKMMIIRKTLSCTLSSFGLGLWISIIFNQMHPPHGLDLYVFGCLENINHHDDIMV